MCIELKRIIKSMEDKYLKPSLDMVRRSFADWSNEEEADLVVRLIKETRSMSTYIPELELIMVNDEDEVIGYALFSGFHLGGKYRDELLLLSPVAVKIEWQRQHISKEIIESAELQKPRFSDLSRFRYHCRRKRRTSCAGVPDGEGACCRCARPYSGCCRIYRL